MLLKTWGVPKDVNKGAFAKWLIEAHKLEWQVGPSHPAQGCLVSTDCLQLSWHFSEVVSSALTWVQSGSSGICQRPPPAVFWGQCLCWLSGRFPLGMVMLLCWLHTWSWVVLSGFLAKSQRHCLSSWNASGCKYWQMEWFCFLRS